MRILFLTNNIRVCEPLYDWLKCTEGVENVILCTDPISSRVIEENYRDIAQVISYNYQHIIKNDVISMFPNNIFNLHISFLPWNRGADPNFWSFIDDSPKGVTIHNIDEGLDTGRILLQKEVNFDESIETFETTYAALHFEIQTLFRDNWLSLKRGEIASWVQNNKGSYHSRAETQAFVEKYELQWSDNIADSKVKIKNGRRS